MRDSWTRTFGVVAVAGVVLLTWAVPGTSAGLEQAAPGGSGVTFTKDVAPILQRSCQNCHRPGAIAPMALLTFEETRPWARSIKQKVTAREMPPWFIDRNVGVKKFKNDVSLSDREIATIAAWVDRGAPMGNPSDMPPPRQFTDLDKWSIGPPDLIVEMPRAFELRANGPDEFIDVLVDPGFKEDVYIAAVETKPERQSFKVVHHSSANIVEYDEDGEEVSSLFFNEYALGKNGDIFPANTGRLVKAGSKININLHLHPYGEKVPVSVSIGMKLMPKGQVPKYLAFTQHMGDVREQMDIPAGEIARSDGYFVLPEPAVLTAFQPHMHNRGRAQCMDAIYPNSVRADSARPGPMRSETLSCVSNYQFAWHISYAYADDVAPLLPAGTIIHVTGWHDNTAANKFNPNPNTWVGYGQRTIDDMTFAWVSLVYLDQEEFARRVEARRRAGATDQQ